LGGDELGVGPQEAVEELDEPTERQVPPAGDFSTTPGVRSLNCGLNKLAWLTRQKKLKKVGGKSSVRKSINEHVSVKEQFCWLAPSWPLRMKPHRGTGFRRPGERPWARGPGAALEGVLQVGRRREVDFCGGGRKEGGAVEWSMGASPSRNASHFYVQFVYSPGAHKISYT